MCQVEISIRTPNFDPSPKFRSEPQISIRNSNFDPKPKFRSEIESKFRSEIEILMWIMYRDIMIMNRVQVVLQ